MTKRTRVIACGALAREIMAIVEANRLDHIDLVCLPAILHNHPERIAPRLEAAILEAREAGYEDILIGYGDCGTGGAIERLCASHGVRMLPGAHCYAFFAGVDEFAARDEINAFYLTDFLARHFETFVVAPLKLRQHPELIEMMFGAYAKVVYLSQAHPPPALEAARQAATFLNLPLEQVETGYGELRDAVTHQRNDTLRHVVWEQNGD